MSLTDTDREILEKTTPIYKATLIDEENDDAPIPLTQISTITLRFYDQRTGTYIRGSADTAQDVKNTNNVTIHATSGLLTWKMQVADTTLVTAADFLEDETEEHVALFEWVLTNGYRGKHIERFQIVQVLKIS